MHHAALLDGNPPKLTTHARRQFTVRTQSECLDRLVLVGEHSLRRAVRQWTEHYHAERNHQGLGNQLIDPGETVEQATGEVIATERLGGLLKYYRREAA